MCSKHPTYKAIRRPKLLKLTKAVCPECLEYWLSIHGGERKGD